MGTLGPISAVNIKLRFPEFGDTDDAIVEFAIEESALFMSSHDAKGKTLAQMYLTAHILAIGNYAADTGGREIAAETLGRLHTKWATSAEARAGAVLGDPSTTSYGRRYQQLQGLNVKMINVIRTTRRHPDYDRW